MSKRKCKNVDITEIEFIEKAVEDFWKRKRGKQMNRRDIRKLLNECPTNTDIAKICHKEIKQRKLNLQPIRYVDKVDKSNGKVRHIAIECAKQQIYDYIASNGLQEIKSRIGFYQIACMKGKGSLMGVNVAYQWMQDPDVKYCIKADLRHCYPSITHNNMMNWLKKHVANDDLLWLINQLLNTVEEGLPIGSRLSIDLSALYLSDLYHCLEEQYYTVRRGKRINTVKHQLFNLDDIYIFGSNAKAMNKMMKDFIKFAESYGLKIKDSWQLIDLTSPDAVLDVLGYKVYKDHITMRKRNYKKLKCTIRQFRRQPTLKNARSLCSEFGFIKNSNSLRFCQKYNLFQALRRAKVVVSNHDKESNFLGKTTKSKSDVTQ